MSRADFEPSDVHVLSDLAQLKVLADPLRVRILEALCRDELTTKQVAERLEEKPTKLYHHVEALERVGLVRLTRTRPNRGTLEKYYRAIARAFQADSSLFAGDADEATDGSEATTGVAPVPEVVAMMLDRTRGELAELTGSGALTDVTDAGLLTFCEIEGSQETIDRLRERLTRLIEETTQCDDDGEPSRRYRLTLAFFPLDRARTAPADGEEPDNAEPEGD